MSREKELEMINRNRVLSVAFGASICASTLPLTACKHTDASLAAPVAATSNPVSAPTPTATAIPQANTAPNAYTLPDADQLYELVAPIALFPDKLIAQVLAGSSYPEQIGSAAGWLAQHSELKGDSLQQAVDQQAWDASVKALTGFPSVLNQMAQNVQWTTALGEAYTNDPTDVMNAIQVLRQRAAAKGALKSDTRQRVSTLTPTNVASDGSAAPTAYQAQGRVIVPPPQTIVIEPAQPNVVYVPAYNPTVVYGMPMPLYPGYVYTPPAYDVLATGLISFGVGVAVGAALDNHYNWGWNAWGAHWGPSYAGGWAARGPGVMYRNAPYVSHSTTIINHGAIVNHTTEIHGRSWNSPNFNRDINRHMINSYPGPYANHHAGPWNTPNFNHDINHHLTDSVPGHYANRPNFDQPTHRANLTQQARNGADRPARPLSTPLNPNQTRDSMAGRANNQGERPGAAALQANHTALQPGLAKSAPGFAPGFARESAPTSARTAPLADRGSERGFSGGGGFGHRGRF